MAYIDAEPNRYTNASLEKKDWDKILDKYEALCNECIDLKLRAEAGENVSGKDIKKLLNKLGSLREDIQEGSGSVSESQRKRFERIKARYSEFFGNGTSISSQSQKQEEFQAKTQEPPTAPITNPAKVGHERKILKEKSEVKDSVTFIPIERPTIEPFHVNLPKFKQMADMYRDEAISIHEKCSIISDNEPVKIKRKRFSYSVVPAFTVAPDFAAGLMFSMSHKAKDVGGYVKVLSDFRRDNSRYECHSDGTYDGGSMWLTGKSSVSKLKLSTGVRKFLLNHYGAYAGAGYGKFVTAWQDISGTWAKVEDKSASGVLCECGILVNFGSIEFSMGVSTISFKYSDLDIGVGIRF